MLRTSSGLGIRYLLLLMLALAASSCALASGGLLDELKSQFNHDKGSPRLILLMSPTCPTCVGGAQWVQQEILDRYPKLKIRVYAVWYSMLPSDSYKAFPAAERDIPDARVRHFWDKKKVAGKWFKANTPNTYRKRVMWDAYYLYDSNAVWDATPSSTVSWGRTILETRKELLRRVSILDQNQNELSQR